MAIDRTKLAKQLPDGTYVCGTLTAANHYGTTPTAFINAAKRSGLKRYGQRSSKGHVAHLWIVDEVEALAAERFARTLILQPDEIVEAPYEVEGD